MSEIKLTAGGELIVKIAKAIGADGAKIRSMVIEAKVGQPVIVYIEAFGDEKLLKIDWPTALNQAVVKRE